MSELKDNSWPMFCLAFRITPQLASELDLPLKKGDNDDQYWLSNVNLVTAMRNGHIGIAYAL
jgi:hypothetical protein